LLFAHSCDSLSKDDLNSARNCVLVEDLPSIYAAAEKVLAKEKYTDWKLTAFKYYYVPAGPIGLAAVAWALSMGVEVVAVSEPSACRSKPATVFDPAVLSST